MGLRILAIVLWIIVILFGALGFILLISVLFNDVYFNTSKEIDPDLAAKFGSFFGGFIGTMFTISSVLLILVTLIKQHIENRKNQIINNFFKMLDYHNENVKQLSVSHIDTTKTEKIEGRRAFVVFKIQISELFNVVNDVIDELEVSYAKADVADIVYTCFYYGIDKDWLEFSKNKLQRYERGNELAEMLLKTKENHTKKIGRTNQTSLSSYFRNLYNAVKLIDQDKSLTINEKKKFVKILRAQLSKNSIFNRRRNATEP